MWPFCRNRCGLCSARRTRNFQRLQVLVQQALDSANKTSTSVALLQNNLQQSFKDQQKSVVDPVVGVGAKLDQMTTDVSSMREAVADISSQMGKLQQQMVDIGNAVRTIQSPAAAPPPTTGSRRKRGRGRGRGECSACSRRDAVSKRQCATAAAGRTTLALQEFGDYLKYYGNTGPGAQRAVLHRGDPRETEQPGRCPAEFDMVLEKYPDNNKTPDALYMKGATLVKMGKRTQGKQEFCELVKRFPSNDLASRAKSQVKALGLTCGAAAPVRKKKS
jgi:TolA-binding protein